MSAYEREPLHTALRRIASDTEKFIVRGAEGTYMLPDGYRLLEAADILEQLERFMNVMNGKLDELEDTAELPVLKL